MSQFEEIDLLNENERKPANRLLSVFHGGVGYVLLLDADEHIAEHVMATGGESDLFEYADYEKPPQGDGVYVYDVALVDDGPGDWPGSREVVVQAANPVAATPEEWKAFCKGELPWT